MRRLRTALAAALVFAALPCVSSAAVTRRTAHTATLLTRGDLLLTGGVDETGATVKTTDLYTASRGNLIVPQGVAGEMQVVRASHTATLMSNGCVLIVGGNGAASDAVAAVPLITAEVYNPQTGAFTFTGSMTADARYNHTATLLNDGTVLVCGGQTDNAGTATASCQLYTPTSCTAGTFAAATPLQQARYNHTAVLLKDGKVWFAGGANPAVAATDGYLVTTERFVPNGGAGTVQSASPLIEARSHHTATLMGDGKVLVVGGYNKRDVIANKGVTQSAEIFDPTSNGVTPAASMSARRQSHSTVLKANGEVVVFGGLGNITTTYITGSALNTTGMTFDPGSAVTANMVGVTAPTATISGGSALLKLDFLLNKPVVGKIADGEIWLSSPAVHAAWGMVNFTPASETVPGTGLHINLAGVSVGCREPSDAGNVSSNCGNIQMTLPASTVNQMTGQIVFYRRTGVSSTLSGATSGSLSFTPATIDSTTTQGTLTAASNFTANLTFPMDKGLIGYKVNAGSLILSAGSIIRTSVFTVTLTAASVGTINGLPSGNVTADIDGNGEVVLNVTFTNLVGTIVYNATSGSLASGSALAAADQVAATVRMTYTMDGANLSNETFDVDIATVVIRKMVFADAETYSPKANAWVLAPPPGITADYNRFGHTTTLMPNNDTFFAGGRACSGATCATQVATTLLYHAATLLHTEKNFAATSGAAVQRRALHTSTLLPDGDILLAGGTNGPSILSDAELFTPASETFSPVNGGMREVRDLHTATLMPNGRVLIAGGFTTNATSTGSTATAEIYYPDVKRFIQTSPMANARSNHGAVMMPDGRVFVAGGFGTGDVITGTSEIFISTKNVWMSAATMPANCQRAIHATVQLKSGKILLIGGVNATGPLTSSALYDPATNTWDCGFTAVIPTALRSHTATLLFDGRVLVAGGNDGLGEANKSYIYDPLANTWTATAANPFYEPRFNHTANMLPNGNVMISGGSQRFGNVPTSIEVFHLNGSSWASGSGSNRLTFFGGARAFHTMNLAMNNKMYGIGGSDGVIGGTGVSLYTSAEAGYFSATPDAFSKDAPPSFRQAVLSSVPATPLLPAANLTASGIRFRGGTEASGGGSASANSAFSFPHMILQQVDGSGGGGSQSNGGFAVDLTTQIFLNAANLATLDTSVTVALPGTSAELPYGWYTLRIGANDIYSDAKMLQIGPLKPTLAPANVTGVAASTISMTWSWDRIAGVDGYNVYNATTGVFLSTIAASLSSRATFYQTNLDASATSSILVAGYTLSGDGPLTASPTSYTLSTCPVSVTIASVTFSDLLLYWGFNGNAYPGTIYEVTQSSDNFVTDISTPIPRLFNLTTNFTIINNLSANTTYFFRVQAFNLIGLGSSFSTAISTRTRAPVTQPIVAGLTPYSIDWAWSDPGGVTNYRVYNATNGVLLATPALNAWTEVNLGTNTEHSIRVTAVTNAGEGPLSPSASAYTLAATPGAFNPRISQLTTGSFLLNWSNNGNPLKTGYESQITQFASDGSTVSVTTQSAGAFTFSLGSGGLIPSTRYGYTLIAINGDGLASDDPPAVTGSTWTLPAAPTSLTVRETSPTSITVDWSANGNASSATYQVTYTTDAFVTHIATAPGYAFSDKYGGTSAVIPNLVTGATYSVRVIASNPFGQLSQFALAVTTRTNNGGAPVGSIQGPLTANMAFQLQGTLGNSRFITINAPEGTFTNNGTVTISPLVPSGKCPVETAVGFSIGITPAYVVQKPIQFSFDFTPADLNGIQSKHAVLLRHDPTTNTCVPLPSRIVSPTKMTAVLDHFSEFIVGQMPLATTSETLRVFPNPVYTDRDGGTVKIIGVPIGTRLRIFTLRGELVYDYVTTTDVTAWDATNGTGRSVASGVYLVMAEYGGNKKIVKLAVIR